MDMLVKARWPTRLRWRVATVAGLSLAGLAVAAAVLQVTTSDLPQRRGVPHIAPPLVAPGVVETLGLPRLQAGGTAAPVAVGDGDLPEINQPLDVVQPLADGALVVHTMRFDGIPLQHRGRRYVLPDATVRGRPDLGRPGRTWYDVGRYRTGEALFVARGLVGGRLRVHVLALRNGLPELLTATVPTPPPNGARTIAVATWSLPVPDLFVIDRGGPRVPATVRIYSGESGFRRLLLRAELPIEEPDARGSVLEVARIQGGQPPDILLIKRMGGSGEPEVHVISGSASFSTFDQHLAVPMPSIPPRDQVVIGTRVGQTTAYVVDLAGPAPTTTMVTLPYRANVPS